ncbi:MAG TPA: methyltransferase domain-containing protein [Candidatus Binataceae bacterium]|nr:methyltransferase domain-containing protein [Candidatus Binataceae bacterium]
MADWDPDLYHRFRRYRAEPFELILGRLPLRADDRIIDYGCGTGENTIELARRVEHGHATGLDSSPAMIGKAREIRTALDAGLRSRVDFIAGDFETFAPDRAFAVVFSNAALQWARDHRAVLTRWFGALAPGGRMVVQMPSNHHETAQTTLGEIAGEPQWRALVGALRTPSQIVREPKEYRAMLAAIGFTAVECYYETFHHPMENPAAIVEFSRATALRPFLERIPAERHDEFSAEFRQRLEQAYGTTGPLTFNFRRLFLWARRPER